MAQCPKGGIGMDEYLEFLVQRVVNKGLGPETIPGLLRDVANILIGQQICHAQPCK